MNQTPKTDQEKANVPLAQPQPEIPVPPSVQTHAPATDNLHELESDYYRAVFAQGAYSPALISGEWENCE